MIKFNPIISIIIGIIATFIIAYIGLLLTLFIMAAALFIGGFIAVYFAINPKIRYGIYEGLCVSLISTLGEIILIPNTGSYSDYMKIAIFITFFVTLGAGFGGYLGKKAVAKFTSL
jgi:hypothetical protein